MNWSGPFLVTLVAVFLLSACGGGGGTSATIGSGTSSLPTGTASVEISWDAPTTRSDGSCLGGDLNGFRVSYGVQSGQYAQSTQLNLNSGAVSCQQVSYDNTCGVSVMRCSHTITGLGTGEWYFTVQAVDTAGLTSAYSLEASTQLN